MAKKRNPKQRQEEAAETPAKRQWNLVDRQNLLPWVFALLAIASGVYAFDSRLSLSGDNAEFVVLGRAVAEGNGLTYVNTLDVRPATKYPFGFPLLIAIVHLIVPNSVLTLKLFVLACFVLSVPLLYRHILEREGILLGTLTAIAVVTCHFTLGFSHQVMSEVPYLAVSVIALLALDAARKSPSPRLIGLAVLAVMSAYYMRTIGISLIVAGAAYFLLHRQYKEAGWFFGGSFLLALPWQIRTALVGGDSYTKTWLFRVDPYRADQGEIGWLGLIDRAFVNLEIYALRVLPQGLIPSWLNAEIAVPIGIAASVCLVYFIISEVARRQVAGIYLALYLGACLIWPTVWSDIRLLAPVLPLIFFGILVTLRDLLSRIPQKPITQYGLTIVAALIVLSNAQSVSTSAGQERRYAPEWFTYFEAARWIRENTASDAVIACRKAYLMSVIADRRTISYTFSDDYDVVMTSLERADYAVVDQLAFSSTSKYLIPTIAEHPQRFAYAHHIPAPDTFILELE